MASLKYRRSEFTTLVFVGLIILLYLIRYQSVSFVDVRTRNDNTVTPVDIRRLGPFSLLPNFKNPCWMDKGNVTRCIPYFFLIGCAKCGSSHLWKHILKHPEVAITNKETARWLNLKRFYGYPFEFYLNWLQTGADQIVRTTDRKDFHPLIIGDGNPSLFAFNDNWPEDPANDPTLLEPHFTTADAIYHLNPKAKIIWILRDPISRLISEYNYFNFTGVTKSAANFHELVTNNIKSFRECENMHTTRHCLYIKHTPHFKLARIWFGVYSVYLKEFLRVFPSKQILLLSMEKCSKDYVYCLERVFNFLDVAPISAETLRKSQETSDIGNKGHHSHVIWNSTRNILKEFYKPYNEELARMLGADFIYNDS